MSTVIRLVSMPQDTSFAPLGVLGYCLTRTDFLAPVFAELELPIKKVDYEPNAKVLDVLVSILAGCRAIFQVNTRIRPDIALACAWGRECFAEQSTLSRTLDAFGEEQVIQLRQGSEALFRRESLTLQHDFAQDWLWLDIDLTPLPASKHAEGSTKGKIGGEKTGMDVSWHVFMRRNTKRPCSRVYIPANNIAVRRISLCSKHWPNSCRSTSHRNEALSSAPIPVLAVMTMSTLP